METTCEAVRKREWRARRRANRRQRCGCCDAIFTPARCDQAFCSAACRQRGFRRRRKAGEPASSRATAPPWQVFSPPGPRNTGEARKATPGAALRDPAAKRIDDLVRALIG
jgi:hypothetical protein